MPSTPNTLPAGFTPALPALILLTTIFFANFLARTIFGPLLLPISQTMGQGLANSAKIYVFLFSGYSVSVLCTGFVSQYLGHKNTIVLSVSLIGLALLGLSWTHSFPALLAWVICIGVGAGLYMPSGVVTITETLSSAYWGRAFAVHELGPNLSFILAPFIVELFLSTIGYSLLFRVIALCCLGLAGVYYHFGPTTKRPGVPPMLGNIRAIISKPAFWIMATLFVLAVGIEIGVYNLVPAFLTSERGVSREDANIILGCSRLLALFCLPATGWVIDRIGYRQTLYLCLAGTAITTSLAGIGPLWWTIAMLGLQPVFVVCFFPVGFAVLSLVCPQNTSDLSVSLTITCSSVLGAGLLPFSMAWAGERIGLSLCFILLGVFILSVSALAIKNLHIPQNS
ncbi:MAG: MFS transporter [Desulfomicrobium sp.]|jgi:MFS family permease|nr:MFS transporter [Desulfomicrobium sp.]NLV95796.1 MFS transporter [Desulfovibrionales bacterium]